jgi:hypothetical protein
MFIKYSFESTCQQLVKVVLVQAHCSMKNLSKQKRDNLYDIFLNLFHVHMLDP